MIDVLNLPAVQALQAKEGAKAEQTVESADEVVKQVAAYPSKKLVLEGGVYRLADAPKQ